MRLDEVKDLTDKITLDVPLFIRLLELSREELKTDAQLHDVATKVIALSKSNKALTMKHYASIEAAK